MIRQMVYAVSGFFCVITGFYFLVPAWNLTANALTRAASTAVTNPTYLNNVNVIASDLNLLVGYSFLGMGIGIWLYLLLFAWRREVVTGIMEEDL